MTSIEPRRRAQQRRATAVLMALVLIAIVAVDAVTIALHGSDGPAPTPIVAGPLPTPSSSPPTGASASPSPSATPVPPDVLAALTGVSPAVEAEVGSGLSSVAMKPIASAPTSAGPRPTVLFVGAEFCPFCASERWSIIQALSRFGRFAGLAEIRSSEGDLPTFDFEKVRFTSSYLTFDPIEFEGQDHQRIGRLTTKQLAVFNKYGGGFPFLYIDGRYAQSGAGYDPEVLAGFDQRQVADELGDPRASMTQSIVGEGNVLTAAICDATGNQPAIACRNAAVVALQQRLTGALPS